MSKTILTIELSEEKAALVARMAAARGLDPNSYAVAAIEAIAEEDQEADEALIIAGREAIKAAEEGRLMTQEQVDEMVFAALAANRTQPKAA